MTDAATCADDMPPAQTAARAAYGLVSAAVVSLTVLAALYAGPGSDLWDHSAVVREFSLRPLAPRHPLTGSGDASAWLTPYHLAGGLVARVTGWQPMTVLRVFGALNVIGLLVFLRLLLLRFFRDERVPVLALLFTQLLWGIWPWYWSGFVHLRVLPMVAPYASTFCFAVTLALLWAFDRALSEGRAAGYALLVLLSAVLVLSHPPTAIPAYLGVAAMLAARVRDPRTLRQALAPSLAVAAGVGLALAWPYLSLFDMATGGGAEYDEAMSGIYQQVLKRTFPALLGVPAVIALWRRDSANPIPWLFAGAVGTYLLGWVTGMNVLGRTLPWAVLSLHTALAWWVVTHAAKWAGRRTALWRRALAYASVLVVAGGAVKSVAYPVAPILELRTDEIALRAALAPVGPDDVVLTDLATSYRVPGVTGKIVATCFPMAFFRDRDQRRNDVIAFFGAEATAAQRMEIAHRRGARFVLLTPTEETAAPLDSLFSSGGPVAASGPYTLFRLR